MFSLVVPSLEAILFARSIDSHQIIMPPFNWSQLFTLSQSKASLWFWSAFLGGFFRYHRETVNAMLARYHNTNENSSLLIEILKPFNGPINLIHLKHWTLTTIKESHLIISFVHRIWALNPFEECSASEPQSIGSFCCVFQLSSFDLDIKFNLLPVSLAQKSFRFLRKTEFDGLNCLISNSKIQVKKTVLFDSFCFSTCKREFRQKKNMVGFVMKWHKNRFHYDGGHDFVFEHDFPICAQRLHHQIENMYDLFVGMQWTLLLTDIIINSAVTHAMNWKIKAPTRHCFHSTRRKKKNRKKTRKQCTSESFFIVHKSLRKLCTIYYLLFII